MICVLLFEPILVIFQRKLFVSLEIDCCKNFFLILSLVCFLLSSLYLKAQRLAFLVVIDEINSLDCKGLSDRLLSGLCFFGIVVACEECFWLMHLICLNRRAMWLFPHRHQSCKRQRL